MKCVLMHCWVNGSYSKTFNNPISGEIGQIREAIETWQPEYIIWKF
jgi:hypothetical protein